MVSVSVLCAGLEAQLLGIVVRKERPELEEQKDSLVINIAAGKKKLQELEDEILRYVAKDFHSARSQITGSSLFHPIRQCCRSLPWSVFAKPYF